MSARLDLEQAVRLHRAERRWLAQCAARLRRGAEAPHRADRPQTATREGGLR